MSDRVPMTPESAAALFLTARGRGGENAAEDNAALTSLFIQVAQAAVRTTLGIDNDKLSLDEILKEITASQPGHRIAPGLQIAYLEDKNLYYAAVHTFPEGNVDSRTVVAKATGPDLVSAMVKCLTNYRLAVAK